MSARRTLGLLVVRESGDLQLVAFGDATPAVEVQERLDYGAAVFHVEPVASVNGEDDRPGAHVTLWDPTRIQPVTVSLSPRELVAKGVEMLRAGHQFAQVDAAMAFSDAVGVFGVEELREIVVHALVTLLDKTGDTTIPELAHELVTDALGLS